MINIVHIGYGYWGANVVRNLITSKNIHLHAVCDMNPARLEVAKKNYGDQFNITSDYEKFFCDPNIDAFCLAIQTEPSFEVAKKILESGKHLFIEKPIATNAERATFLHELAMENNLVLHCDHIMIYHPIIRYIKNMYEAGELGELVYFDISRMNLGPIRQDVNAMLDLAVHDLAVIDYISGGMVPIHLEAVGEKRYGKQETLTYLTMKYESFIAHIKSSWLSPIKERRTMIGGTKKMVIFDDAKTVEKLMIYDHGIVQRDEQDESGIYEF